MAKQDFKEDITKRFNRAVEILKELGYTSHTQIADLIEQPLQTVSKLISGERIITLEQASALSRNSRINLAWLLTGIGSELIEGDTTNVIVAKKHTDATVAPLISQYAYAGYLAGFVDPEYLDAQPQFTASKKHNGGHYVAFEVKGDSMDDGTKRSICEGDIILGRELQKHHWQHRLHVPKVFIIVHKTDGIICKEIIKHDVSNGEIICHSWNPDPDYEDFELNLRDVMQLFYVKEISRQNKY